MTPWGIVSSPPRQAWGTNTPRKYQIRLRRHEAFLKPKPDQSEVNELLEKVQADVCRRRLRVKDNFADFDPLRTGKCTQQQFIRAVTLLVPAVLPAQKADVLAEHYRDDKEVVNYKKFVQDIETGMVSVPKSENRLQTPRTPIGKQVQPGLDSDEVALEPLFRRMGMLIRTRGLVFRECFQDAERSHSTSVMCPRYSGKVTRHQFMSHFPFTKECTPEELMMLLLRYETDSGDINYLAFEEDLQPFIAVEQVSRPPTSCTPMPHLHLHLAPGLQDLADDMEQHQRILEVDRHVISREHGHYGRDTEMSMAALEYGENDAVYAWDVVERIKAIVHERRLSLHGSFKEFDRLHHGVCNIGQVRTVFTILKIHLEPKEFTAATNLFLDDRGMFCYREFCKVIDEAFIFTLDGERPASSLGLSMPRPGSVMTARPGSVMMMTPRPGSVMTARPGSVAMPSLPPASGASYAPTSPSPARTPRTASKSRRRHFLDAEKEDKLIETLDRIAKITERIALPLKGVFKDFDSHSTGHISKHQFLRVADMLQLNLTEDMVRILFEAFADPSCRAYDFGYHDFCKMVAARVQAHHAAREHEESSMALSLLQDNSLLDERQHALYWGPKPSKYFNRRGQIVPLGMSAAPPTARPFTR